MPQIETQRLILRPHRVDDFPAMAAIWADPVLVRFFGGKPVPREDSWSRLLRYAGHWALLEFGYWAVEEKSTGLFIGEVGFADYYRDIEPPLNSPEIGWVLASSAHGKGYATEAVLAVTAWGDTNFSSERTCCIIHPDNLASLRVAAKCGYAEKLRTEFKGQPTIVFERTTT